MLHGEEKGGVRSLLRGLGRTYGSIFDFSFGGRSENRYEMAFELVSGADLGCFLHHVVVPDPFQGVLGPSLAGQRPKPETKM